MSTKRNREEKSPTQATVLLELAAEARLILVHTPEGEPYVFVPVSGHLETLPLRGRGFGAWLRWRYFAETGKAANAQAVSDALGTLEMRALSGDRVPVSVRVASDGWLYIDLGGPDWRVVEATACGWEVIYRRQGARPLQAPLWPSRAP